jgi:hypothetical protein
MVLAGKTPYYSVESEFVKFRSQARIFVTTSSLKTTVIAVLCALALCPEQILHGTGQGCHGATSVLSAACLGFIGDFAGIISRN